MKLKLQLKAALKYWRATFPKNILAALQAVNPYCECFFEKSFQK